MELWPFYTSPPGSMNGDIISIVKVNLIERAGLRLDVYVNVFFAVCV